MKKILKKIGIGILLIAIYLNIGSLVDYGLTIAAYYPTSIAAKILMPICKNNFIKLAPFSKSTPKINKDLKEEYGSFENCHLQKGRNWGVIIIWPFVLFIMWLGSLITWIIFLFWYLFLALKFLFGWAYIILSEEWIYLLLK